MTKRKHIPTWLFKQSIDLTRQQRAIEQAVSEIGVLNARKKLINHTGIPQHQIGAIARCLMPDILAFYESEEGQREFSERKERREAEKWEVKIE